MLVGAMFEISTRKYYTLVKSLTCQISELFTDPHNYKEKNKKLNIILKY